MFLSWLSFSLFFWLSLSLSLLHAHAVYICLTALFPYPSLLLSFSHSLALSPLLFCCLPLALSLSLSVCFFLSSSPQILKGCVLQSSVDRSGQPVGNGSTGRYWPQPTLCLSLILSPRSLHLSSLSLFISCFSLFLSVSLYSSLSCSLSPTLSFFSLSLFFSRLLFSISFFLLCIDHFCCSPLLTVVDNLLVMGLLDDTDLNQLLNLIDPTRFDPAFDRGTYLREQFLQSLAKRQKDLSQLYKWLYLDLLPLNQSDFSAISASISSEFRTISKCNRFRAS